MTMGMTPAVGVSQEAPRIDDLSVRRGDRVQAGRSFYQAGRFAEAATAWQAAAQTYGAKGDRENRALSLIYIT